MSWDNWRVTKQIEPDSRPNKRQVYIEMLEQLIEKLKETETYNLTGTEEEICPLYAVPTITFFCVNEDDPDKIEIRCYWDRREFLKELKKEDEAYKARNLAKNNTKTEPDS